MQIVARSTTISEVLSCANDIYCSTLCVRPSLASVNG